MHRMQVQRHWHAMSTYQLVLLFIVPISSNDFGNFTTLITSRSDKEYTTANNTMTFKFANTIENISMKYGYFVKQVEMKLNCSRKTLAEGTKRPLFDNKDADEGFVVKVNSEILCEKSEEIANKSQHMYISDAEHICIGNISFDITHLAKHWMSCEADSGKYHRNESVELVLSINNSDVSQDDINLQIVEAMLLVWLEPEEEACNFDDPCNWEIHNIDRKNEQQAEDQACYMCLPDTAFGDVRPYDNYGVVWIELEGEFLKKGSLETKWLNRTFQSCKLSFMVASSHSGTLNVRIITQNASRIVYWLPGADTNREWMHETIHIGRIDEVVKIRLELSVSSTLSHIALDNIYTHGCSETEEEHSTEELITPVPMTSMFHCSAGMDIAITQKCDAVEDCLYAEDESEVTCENVKEYGRCNFESNNCTWWNEGDCKWVRQMANDTILSWKIDHSLRTSKGHLMYIDYTTSECEKNKAVWKSPPFNPSQLGDPRGNFAIKLFYNLHQSRLTVEMITVNNVTSLMNIDQPNRHLGWQLAHIHVNNVYTWFTLKIVGKLGESQRKGHKPFIGFDDLSISPWVKMPDLQQTEVDGDVTLLIKTIVGVPALIFLLTCFIFSVLMCRNRWVQTMQSYTTRQTMEHLNSIYEDYFGESQSFLPHEDKQNTNISTNSEISTTQKFNCMERASYVPFDRLRISRLIGKGAFGEVYTGMMLEKGCTELPVAIKKISSSYTEDTKMDFFLEILILSKFNHPNIVRQLGVSKDGSFLYMILELMSKRDLRTFLRQNSRSEKTASTLGTSQLLMFSIDIAKGCYYLECNKIVHRDLAARNCLLNETQYGLVAKICDFGLAKDIMRSNYYRKHGSAMVPVKWMPPEAFQHGIFTTKTDVWAFGVLLWELFSFGRLPYPSFDNHEVMQFVLNGGRMIAPPHCLDSIYVMMSYCWSHCPKSRPGFMEILQQLQEIYRSEDDKRQEGKICVVIGKFIHNYPQ